MLAPESDPQLSGDSSGRPWTSGLQTIGLILATWTVYLPAIRNGFVWDDKLHLIDNIVLQENGLFRVWFTADYINYWPLTWTSYWLEYQWWGLDPAGYHVTNILLHTLSAIFVWRVLKQLQIPAAWFAALVFAIHPVNVESVAWIAQRKNVLCLFFYLAAIHSYLKFDEQGSPGRYIRSLMCFLLAMLSKGAAAALPVVLLLCLWWRRNSLCRRDVLRTLPFFALSGVMSLVEIWFQYVRSIADEVVREDSLLSRVTGAGWIVWFYLSKSILPLNLSFVYPRWTIDPARPLSHVPNLALLVVACIAWKHRRSWGRPIVFALAYFVVTLSPVLGFFNIYFMRYSFVADHYQYLSIVAPVALVVGGAWQMLSSYGDGVARWTCAAALMVAAGLGLATWQQTQVYESQITLWRDTLQKNPDAWLAHYNLANIYSEQQKWEPAAEHYRHALRINEDDAWAHHNLGLVLERLGNFAAAADAFQRAYELDATLAQAQYNLGNLRVRQNRLDEAVDHYRRALEIDPALASAENNLAALLERQGEVEQAIVRYRRSLAIDPDSIHAHQNLGRLLIDRGDRGRGEAHLREAARLRHLTRSKPRLD
jgi:protein O-mannosyl-transferase